MSAAAPTSMGLGLAPILLSVEPTACLPGLTFSGYTPSLGWRYCTSPSAEAKRDSAEHQQGHTLQAGD